MLTVLGQLALLLVISFLLGSIPWGVIISRVFYHTDLREHGSGNIGTTNAIQHHGEKWVDTLYSFLISERV